MSLYVAEAIDADILLGYPDLRKLNVKRLRPGTLAFSESDLVRMNSYLAMRDQMRNS